MKKKKIHIFEVLVSLSESTERKVLTRVSFDLRGLMKSLKQAKVAFLAGFKPTPCIALNIVSAIKVVPP